MPERMTLEDNTLTIELGETEAKIISRTHAFLFPLLASYIFMICRLILAIAPLGRDKAKEMAERMSRGEDLATIFQEAGIDIQTLITKDIQFPPAEEVDKALGWIQQ